MDLGRQVFISIGISTVGRNYEGKNVEDEFGRSGKKIQAQINNQILDEDVEDCEDSRSLPFLNELFGTW